MRASLNRSGGWSWTRAASAGFIAAIAVGIPTDVIDTPYFTRMLSTRWWDYLTLAAIAVLSAAWFGLRRPRANQGRADAPGVVGLLGSALAVGCPICNKAVVALLGVSGALTIWAPIQPLLAAASVAILFTALIVRWRGIRCDNGTCVPGATMLDNQSLERRGASADQPRTGQESTATTASAVPATATGATAVSAKAAPK